MKNLCFLVVVLLSISAMRGQQKVNVNEQLAVAEKQYALMLAAHPDTGKIPFSALRDGSLKDMPSGWWCSGFFGGTLWYLFEYTGNPKWKEAATRWTSAVEKEQYNTSTHDLGFMLYCPFGNGYRLTRNPAYRKVLLQGARSLATRFNPSMGVIKSWDRFDGFDFPVIIDNMMNLELLFWAARNSKDKNLRVIATAHADATMRNHFRPDNSSYHVVCYDDGGKILARKTAQGASDSSAWARGQAWGLYGFTVMYRETKNPRYLQQAEKIAAFYLQHPNLPADKIPFWDFNAPAIPHEERDASAAAIACSALLELSQYAGKAQQKTYFMAAETMLQHLSDSVYRAALGENNNFLIKHCVGHKPQNSEVDVPLIYADYYYIEALLRYQKIRKSIK